MQRRAILALGSNLGDRVGFLRDAVAAVPDLVASSPVYETDPIGGPDAQGSYLNMAVELRTSFGPWELLDVCRSLERAAGRKRIVHWGPRTLDCDVVWIDGIAMIEQDLVVPHPRYRERNFVLAPLWHLAPDLVPDEFDVSAATGVYLLGDLEKL